MKERIMCRVSKSVYLFHLKVVKKRIKNQQHLKKVSLFHITSLRRNVATKH